MKEYFNGFSTQDLVDMRRNDEKRKEKVEMEKEIERLNNDIKELLKENSNKEKVIKAQDNIIKEVRELLNQEWYSVLRKETIRKVREILDKENI